MKPVSGIYRQFYLFLLFFIPLQSLAQEKNAAWMLKDLLNNSSSIDEILIFETQRQTHPFYYPDDLLPYLKNVYVTDLLIKNRLGLFTLIDNTGHIYKIHSSGEEIKFDRIDSTYYQGYNAGAFIFSFRDTIFSMGGYGFWRRNGHLRYYKPSLFGWEIMPLNREIAIEIGPKAGGWISTSAAKLYYVEKFIGKLWLKDGHNNFKYYPDTSNVSVLDLESKNWQHLGTLNSEARELMNTSRRYGSIPWGELAYVHPVPNQTIYLFNYASNKIYLLNKAKASAILDAYHPEQKLGDSNKRIMFYFKDSTLHVVTSWKEHLKIPLSLSDFTPTETSIYDPVKEPSVWDKLDRISVAALVFSMLLAIGSVVVLIRNWKPEKKNQPSNSVAFDNGELALIISIISKSDCSILPDEANTVLGTTRKSLDVQKKHRSDTIKAVNEKYRSLTRESNNLIDQERLQTDRRQVRYLIMPEKYLKIKPFLPHTSLR